MFKIGDTIIYSDHGLCEIDDICEQTFAGITRNYYILHPLADTNLKISAPVDSDKVLMLRTMNQEEAESVLQTFNQPGIDWIEDSRQRNREYTDHVQSGDRNSIAKIINTLMRKNAELKLNGKRIYDQDRKLLQLIQSTLFNELALSLDTSYEAIEQRVNRMLENGIKKGDRTFHLESTCHLFLYWGCFRFLPLKATNIEKRAYIKQLF